MGWHMENGYWSFSSKDKVDGKHINANTGMTVNYIKVLSDNQKELERKIQGLENTIKLIVITILIQSVLGLGIKIMRGF